MLGKKRVETRAMLDVSREYAHRHGQLSMMDHAALVSTLAKRDWSNEAVCQHSADLPTTHASDLLTLNSVCDVEDRLMQTFYDTSRRARS